jgi:hypothetical protein
MYQVRYWRVFKYIGSCEYLLFSVHLVSVADPDPGSGPF